MMNRPVTSLNVVLEATLDEISLAETVGALLKPCIEKIGPEKTDDPETEELAGYIRGVLTLASKLISPRPGTASVGVSRILGILEDYTDDDGKYNGPQPVRDETGLLRVL
jgi:hypothetical protein